MLRSAHLTAAGAVLLTALACRPAPPSVAPEPRTSMSQPGTAAATLPAAAPGDAPIADAITPDTVEFPSDSLRLRGLVYRPAGPGPHPAVLFLHGSSANYDRQMAAVGPMYARAGYLLFVPFRRGQGLSAGRGEAITVRLRRESQERGAEAWSRLLAELLATEQLDDVRAALTYLRQRPDVDSGRVAVAGNSFGGILSVLAGAHLPGLRAAIASAPAAQTWSRAPELRMRLQEAARAMRVPLFLFQAENDQDLTPTTVLASELAAAGRPHRRTIYPPFGATAQDGHAFGYYGGAIYGPDVFAFLRETLGPAPGAAARSP